MRPIPANLTWKSGEFLLRLLASYLLVPLVPGILLQLIENGSPRITVDDRLATVLFYGVFGFAAMLALGTPLLVLYLWLGWTNFLSFMAGGGLCAGLTVYAMGRGHAPLPLAGLFATFGIISGAVFRLILFGAQTYHPAPNQGVSK